MNNVEFGKYGEEIASKYLIKQNYVILERNYRTRLGEIDIIAKENKEIVFVEVKSRKSFRYGRAVEAVNKTKQKHIKNTANFYLYKNRLNNMQVRFDVIEIYFQNGKCFVNQIKKAF